MKKGPAPVKKAKKNNKMKKMFNQVPSKSFHEFEQELLKTIPSSKSTMINRRSQHMSRWFFLRK